MRLGRLGFPLACASMACVGAPPPPPAGDGSSTVAASTETTETALGTTAPVDDTSATAGGTGTSTSVGDTSSGGSSSTGDTTMGIDPSTSSGGESSSSGPPPECMSNDQCPNNEICDLGNCVDACGGAWAAGTYDACINEYGGSDVQGLCGNASDICIVDANPVGASTCSVQSCTDACDCPAPPGTGDAVVTCANITSGGSPNDCYLDCSNGETCPTGMGCFAGYVCMTPLPADVPTYGNCEGVTATCAAPAFCFTSGSTSVCQQDCGSAADCPAAPPTGTAPVACGYVNMGNPGGECYLDCSGGQTCPTGMFCFDDTLCAFP